MSQKNPFIICLMGPTASGKTNLALELVKRLPCEIISVDSAMIYREMDIGTAKPTFEQQNIAPHRLLDICDPSESYSAGRFREDAVTAIQEIIAKDKIPLLVGGTMLYFRVLQQGLSELPQANTTIRNKILQEANEFGWEKLHQRLQEIDPESAKRIHPNDPQRLQRALEVFELTGKSLTELWRADKELHLPFSIINISVAPAERHVLHDRIAKRFVKMLEDGFVGEVEHLYKRGDLHNQLPSIRSVGYRQAWDYLAGHLTREEMSIRAIAATRQLAKRQLTWLRSWVDLAWFDSEDRNLLEKILKLLAGSVPRNSL